MNELTLMTDTQLDKAIEDLKERELAIKTQAGQAFVVSKMRECIGWLESVGYKFDGDETALARLWAHGLQDDFVRLGEVGVKNAVMSFAETDTRTYKTMPQIAWISDKCSEMGGDPRKEKGRRVQAEAERQIEEDHKREMEEIKKDPVRWAEICRKAEEMERRGAVGH